MAAIERLVLRADLLHHGRQLVAHTIELTARSVFVRTDELFELGDKVSLRVSLSRLLPPLLFEAHVESVQRDDGPGYFAGITLAFSAIEETQQLLSRLLSREGDRKEPGTCRILAVEDSEIMRACLQLGADRMNNRPIRIVVDAADTAEHAVALMQRESYELALVDYFLPGAMNGAELVQQLRAGVHSELPIIAVSTGGVTARDAFLAAGADVFLDKPVIIKDLFATLERLMLMRSAA
jgi:CheY-like chemotaxis protein